MPELRIVPAPAERVWRVGFKPDPWAWSGWEWATDGRFNGRWDDSAGNFRTVYAGESLLACLLEVLAAFRPDPQLLVDLDEIDEDPADANHPTSTAGEVPYSWLEHRTACSATLTGDYCDVAHSDSVAALRPRFISAVLHLGRQDFDTATLKDPALRSLTQPVATHLVAVGVDGVTFTSRHGEELSLWAIFERPDDGEISPHLVDRSLEVLTPEHPELQQAMAHHDLHWLVESQKGDEGQSGTWRSN